MNNREISFRVWDKLLKRWGDPDKFLGISLRGDLICENQINPRQSVVQQFTGLKDRNGKKIFEGDILRDREDTLKEVVWGTGGFFLRNTIEHQYCAQFLGFECPDTDKGILKYFKLVGNIFENPEFINQ